jgi:hypothetical protein
MTGPGHRDVAVALGATLATFRGERDVLDVLAAQCRCGEDADRFIAALLSAFATFVARKTTDPESYLLQWIALQLQLADDEEQADTA